MANGAPVLSAGVYTPLPTFFNGEDELDVISYKEHVLRIVGQGAIPVCAGSLGEAVHLDAHERKTIIRITRSALDAAGLDTVPIVAGVGAPSTRETIRLAHDAAEAGANFGMIIPPAYYAATLQQDETQITQYYIDVCQESRIPILLYNFPANAAGQDLGTSLLSEIAIKAPNLAGMKLTCVGRIEKLRSLLPTCTGGNRTSFIILDGVVEDLPTWTSIGGHGTVSGISNLAPAATVRLLRLCLMSDRSRDQDNEIEEIRAMLASFDAVCMPLGVRGLKYALWKLRGYNSSPRRPLLPLDDASGKQLNALLDPLMELECRYSS